MLSLPLMAKSSTPYGKAEQHCCTFWANKKLRQRKQLTTYANNEDLVLICFKPCGLYRPPYVVFQNHWPLIKPSWRWSRPACPTEPWMLGWPHTSFPSAAVFPATFTETTWTCRSLTCFLSYFLSCFQLAHHFPSLSFTSSSLAQRQPWVAQRQRRIPVCTGMALMASGTGPGWH